MDVRHVTVPHRGLAVAALRAAPPGDGPYPGVLLVHDAWGLDGEVAALVGTLAAAGFTVLAPDLLGGRRAVDADEAHAIAAGLDPEDAALLLAAAADALTADPATRPRRIGAVGLGMGAPLAAFLATIRPEIGVAVLAGPVPELPLEAWTRAEAAIVVLEAADATDDADGEADTADGEAEGAGYPADAADPAVALDRARAAGRTVEVIGAPGGDAELAPLIVEVLAARLLTA
jgi:dienelactone hydrolase